MGKGEKKKGTNGDQIEVLNEKRGKKRRSKVKQRKSNMESG